MNKREFLKSSGALVAGSCCRASRPASNQPAPRENWAGNLTYSTDHLLTPASVDEVRQAVKSCTKLRALGTRHSFNAIADSTQNQISLKQLDPIDIDDKARTVTVGAGVTYGKLAPVIDARGYALHNLASLPHISVAGAIATATHGSGIHNGNLATAGCGARNRHRRWRGHSFVAREGRRPVPRRRRRSRRARRRHPRHPQSAAHLPGRPVRLSESFLRPSGASLRRDLRQRLQRQPLHRLAESSATQVWIKRRLAPGDKNDWQPEILRRQTRHRESCTPSPAIAAESLHRAAGHSRPLVRAPAAFQHELHALQRPRIADRILRPPRARLRGHSRRRKTARPASRRTCSSPSCAPSPPTTCG